VRVLRISVTDRCNFRCGSCMPVDKRVCVDRGDLMRCEE
jgi:molybdenum cofactor biosynthesis enzyme MoaA